MAEKHKGVVQEIEYVMNGAGNQFTTIEGVRYVTFWDIRTRDWVEGDLVEFTVVQRSLWDGGVKRPHAENIKKVVSV